MQQSKPMERLASALQECLNEAAELGAKKAAAAVKKDLTPRLDRQDETIKDMRKHMDGRLDRQDETLRMVWKQVKGTGPLPIDEGRK